jgi:hypothetical protein
MKSRGSSVPGEDTSRENSPGGKDQTFNLYIGNGWLRIYQWVPVSRPGSPDIIAGLHLDIHEEIICISTSRAVINPDLLFRIPNVHFETKKGTISFLHLFLLSGTKVK